MRYSLLSFAIAATCILADCWAAPEQGVLQEIWLDIPGDRVADLTEHPRYAELADRVSVLGSFETVWSGDGYGSRFTALLVPPQTGEYTFWVASDDGGELWLSEDDTPEGLRLIARVRGWTGPNEWDAQAGQRSEPVRLVEGGRYYIQALHKEVGGGDHLSVAWEGPGIARQIIAGKYLVLPEMEEALAARIEETRRREAQEREDVERAGAYWKSGKTLPLEWSERYPLPSQSLPNDTGINVLLDHAHQVSFAMLWGLSGQLRQDGFRVCGSQATLNTVLSPGSLCRVRLSIGNTFPFGWWQAPEFNVVITYQGDPNAQSYLPEEREALRSFVEQGGGLIIIPSPPQSEEIAEAWSINALASDFGAFITAARAATAGRPAAVLELSEEWEVTARGENGEPVRARRSYGTGRIVLLEGRGAIADGEGTAEVRRELVTWAASGKEPVGGPARVPTEMAGGGGIYPELEQHLGGIVLYYAQNQTDDLLKVFTDDLPEIKDKVYEWLPSPPPEQPMYVIASSGGGGGWACNYLPKENGIISLSPVDIVGVFAHELAHTMCGPVNDSGVPAGRSPHGVQGEAHAGWFQGKAYAHYDEARRDQPCRGARERQTGENAWSSYAQWWWLWQKMDDRYGATWFPRWYWVRATRWQDEPAHVETWDEMVEDMCIAVGEDLFPFMNQIGAPVTRERLERMGFQGEVLELPVADIDTGPAGAVVLDRPGDYTQPLRQPGRPEAP